MAFRVFDWRRARACGPRSRSTLIRQRAIAYIIVTLNSRGWYAEAIYFGAMPSSSPRIERTADASFIRQAFARSATFFLMLSSLPIEHFDFGSFHRRPLLIISSG